MLWLIICLAVFCFVLLLMLGKQDDKNSALAAENGLLKGRLENQRENGFLRNEQSNSHGEPLTVAGIEDAVRHAGYVPDTSDGWVRFMVAGETFYIETGRLPQIFVHRYYNVNTNDWDMPLLKHAAHVMADELIMVKAVFDERHEGTVLRFFIASMDRNYASFRDNLLSYIGIISDGKQRMTEIYDTLVEEKQNPALAVAKYAATSQQDPKLLS